MKASSLTSNQKQLRRRIVELTYQLKWTHLGSCLTAVDIIDLIYQEKSPTDLFVLSNGHAGLAYYVVLEKYGYISDSIIRQLHVHPDRQIKYDIQASTGSLGQGLPIAVGMALADRRRRVFCLVSDGECSEGSIWESLRVMAELNLTNLTVLVNANGWAAYQPVKIPVFFCLPFRDGRP